MGDVEGKPRRRTRAGRVGSGLTAVVLVGLTLWLLGQAVTTTWDAAALMARGEVVSARVVDVDLHTRLGMADELVVAPDGATTPVEISTHREDIPVGAVVDVVVDPAAADRAALDGDGWPWLETVLPLVLAPVCALAALLTLGTALGATKEAGTETPAAGPTAERTTDDA